MGIPEDIRAWLLEPRLLQEWAPYTIRERVVIAQRVWTGRLRLSVTTLLRFYKANGVRNRAAKKVYEIARAESETKEEERKIYARVLGSVIVSRHHYIYVDETTFDSALI